MKQKGQITIEFIIAVGVLTVLFAYSIFIFAERSNSLNYSKEAFNSEAQARKLAAGINNVFLSGEGTETIIFIEENDFNIEVSNGSVRVWHETGYASAKILVSNATGEIKNGEHRIRHLNGGIVIEQ